MCSRDLWDGIHVDDRGGETVVGDLHALGQARGPRGVEDEGGVVVPAVRTHKNLSVFHIHCKNLSRHFDDNSMANFHYNIVVTPT